MSLKVAKSIYPTKLIGDLNKTYSQISISSNEDLNITKAQRSYINQLFNAVSEIDQDTDLILIYDTTSSEYEYVMIPNNNLAEHTDEVNNHLRFYASTNRFYNEAAENDVNNNVTCLIPVNKTKKVNVSGVNTSKTIQEIYNQMKSGSGIFIDKHAAFSHNKTDINEAVFGKAFSANNRYSYWSV